MRVELKGHLNFEVWMLDYLSQRAIRKLLIQLKLINNQLHLYSTTIARAWPPHTSLPTRLPYNCNVSCPICWKRIQTLHLLHVSWLLDWVDWKLDIYINLFIYWWTNQVLFLILKYRWNFACCIVSEPMTNHNNKNKNNKSRWFTNWKVWT